MAKSYSDYLLELFNKIAEKEPMFVCRRKGSRYIKEYWKYKNIKICVTKQKIDNEIMSISLTKL